MPKDLQLAQVAKALTDPNFAKNGDTALTLMDKGQSFVNDPMVKEILGLAKQLMSSDRGQDFVIRAGEKLLKLDPIAERPQAQVVDSMAVVAASDAHYKAYKFLNGAPPQFIDELIKQIQTNRGSVDARR